ncbi:DUF4912 domain-containing protein, partial [Pyxidicoccus sp. 3LG]
MDDLKSVTVGYLRELAQKHLGSGYSKLKKEELISALAAYVPALAKLARLAGITVPRKSSTAKDAAVKKAAPEPEPRKAASKVERPKARSAASSKEKDKKAREAKAPKVPVKEAKAPKAAKVPVKEPKAAKVPVKEAKEPRAAKVVAGDAKEPGAPKATVEKPPAKGKPEELLGQEGRVSAPKRVAAKRASEKPGANPPARPAQVVSFPPKPRGARDTKNSESSSSAPPVESGVSAASGGVAAQPPEAPAASEPVAPPPPPVVQHVAEPVVEGFFVARVIGEDEARRHHLVDESQGPASADGNSGDDEGLGELPAGYQDDSALLLPRDPHTLFVSWDFSEAARHRARKGLDSPRTVLRVFEGEKLVRELDFALEARGLYIHDLPPGRFYRVEAHFVGRDGRAHRIGPSTNRVALPPTGTSTDTSVRFLRVPMPRPEPQFVPEAMPPARTRIPEVEEREYITWRRVNLPGSAGVQDIPESRRERTVSGPGGPGADSHMEAPPRAPGASDQRYMDAQARVPGASDMRYLESAERAPGASEQRYLESPGRAPGASEQRYVQGAAQPRERQYLDIGRGPGGASDMRYLEGAGRVGGWSAASASVPRHRPRAGWRFGHALPGSAS